MSSATFRAPNGLIFVVDPDLGDFAKNFTPGPGALGWTDRAVTIGVINEYDDPVEVTLFQTDDFSAASVPNSLFLRWEGTLLTEKVLSVYKVPGEHVLTVPAPKSLHLQMYVDHEVEPEIVWMRFRATSPDEN